MNIKPNDNTHPLYQRKSPEEWSITTGMTIREHFAIMAMQGLISHYGYGEAPVADAEELAQWSVKLADALLDELHQ